MRRSGRFRIVLTSGLKSRLQSLVELPEDVIQQTANPLALRQECLSRFRKAAFSLHVEEHFRCTKRDRENDTSTRGPTLYKVV